MRLRALIGFLSGVLLLPGTAVSQTSPPPASPPSTSPSPPPETNFWAISDSTIAVIPARIGFPRTAGVVTAYQNGEFSLQGQGLDLGVQYRSPDRAIFATAYVYYPGLAHTGLTAFATDDGMRRNSPTPLSGGEARTVAAGGVNGVAIRRDCGGYRSFASSAAFIKTDRWMIKLRVSGPEARRVEVMAAMDALLAGITFGRQFQPRPAAIMTVDPCPAAAGGRAAGELQDPSGSESAAHAFLATLDGGGNAATGEGGERRNLPSRVPSTMCLSQNARLGQLTIPILRGVEGPALSIDGRTMLLAILNDAGDTVEVVHAPNLQRFWLLRHRIGETLFLRSFDGVPSDEQVIEAIDANLSGRRPVNIRVRLSPDGRDQIFIPGAPAARPARTGA